MKGIRKREEALKNSGCKGNRENQIRYWKESGHRKGFVFTILTLVIIVFMIIELNIYFRTYELKLENEPTKLRLEVMQDFIRAYSPNYFNNTAYAFLYSALYKLNNDSVSYPPSQSTLADLLWNISYTGKRTDRNTQLIDSKNTLSAYDSNLSALAKSMNIDLDVKYYNFSIDQVDFWTVQYNFTMNVSIFDKTSSTSIKFNSPISLNISIIGFQDPWLARMGFLNRSIIPVNKSIDEIRPQLVMNGTRGRGWFYGETIKVTSCPSEDFVFPDSFFENKTKIMVTNNVGVATGCGQLFGAVIVLNDSQADSDAFAGLDVPLFINSSASFDSLPASVPLLMVSDNDTEITDSSAGHYHYLLNITELRNAIECGKYFERPGNNYGYLTRLTNNIPGVMDEFGIETILSGTSQSPIRFGDWKSFVDREYNSSRRGDIYKGLPGCSNELICNYTINNPSQYVPYPTRLSSESAKYYLGIYNSSMKR